MKTLKERKSQRNSLQETFMKKAKLLTVLGVMLAMGVTACTGTEKSSNSSQGPAPSTTTSKPSTSSTASSSSSSSSQGGQSEVADPDGHHFGADADVAADAEAGTVAYKKAECADNDGFSRLKINQSAVTYGANSSRKSGTPDGYTKLANDGETMSFKIKTDKKYSGKLFLYGVMDGYSSNYTKNFCYYGRNGATPTPNVEVKVNGEVVDISAQKNVTFQDIFGAESDPNTDNLSPENYALLGNIVLNEGVNEIIYKRVQTLNMLIKDFVFVVEEYSDWTAEEAVAAKGEGYVGYTKRTSRIDGATKIEIRALDGSFAEGSKNKDNTEEGYLKLDSNGNKISWKFDFAKAGFAQIYQVGFMDSYSSNDYKTYAHTSSSDSTKTTEEGNLRVKFNSDVVDKGPYMKMTFAELTADGEKLFEDSKNFSLVALLPLGQANMAAGDNIIEFERLGSYNFAVSKLVIYFYETAPQPAAEFKGDAYGHWNEYANLPKARFNYAAHTENETAFTNSQGKEGKIKTCSVCGQMIGAVMDLLACDDASSIQDGKLALNTAYTWRFKLGEANAAAGKAAFYMTVKRGAASTNLASGYTLSSGEVNGTVTCINERIGSGYSNAKELKIGEIEIEKLDAQGEFVVTFKTPEAQDNMPIFSGDVRLAYIG